MSDNPFLLPPGGAKPDSRPPRATEPVVHRDADAGVPAPAAPLPDPSHYIAVPASVESATHRIARPAPEPEQIAAEPEPESAPPVSEPAPAPAPVPVPEPVPQPEPAPAPEPAPKHLAAEAGVSEETRMAPPAAPRAWALVLPDGTRVSLAGPLLLGRDPAGIPDRPEAGLLPVVDIGKTVSKTHALIEPTPEGIRVRDLHSTNGVAVDTAAGRQLVSAGTEAVAPRGATIMLGSFPIRVDA